MPGRVLRIVTRLNQGGPLRQLCALAPALVQRGWEGPILAGRTGRHEPDGTDRLRGTGADVVRVRALARGVDPGADARAFRTILAAIRHVRPDVVHTHMAKAGALGRLAARIAGVPAVHTYHGHHLQAPWPRDVLARRAERTLARITAAGICLTPRQRRDLVETHRVIAGDKVHVMAPGLDVADLRRRAGAGERSRHDRPLFLWAGRFVEVKDPLGLVRAVALSQRAFHLVMLGVGPTRAAVRRRIQAEGLQDVVSCPGASPDIAPWLAACDAVVLSSRSEGAPMLVVEAKVLGRPAIVTAVGGVPDLVGHGVDGWWVPPDSPRELARALDLLAADAELRERLGRQAAVGADQRFAAARLADETAALYEGVCRPRRYHRRDVRGC